MRVTTRKAGLVLWIVQAILAVIFLFSGGMKLVMPLSEMTGPIALPGWFVRFLGVAEVLGALGLVLPGAFRIRTGLTPLAAAGLVIIMIGATVLTVSGFTAAVGVLLAVVIYGRSTFPRTFRVERASSIEAPPDKILELI